MAKTNRVEDGIKPFDVATTPTEAKARQTRRRVRCKAAFDVATTPTEAKASTEDNTPRAEDKKIPPYRYKVSVPHGPSWVVAVSREDEGAAWNEFKAQTGLIRTEHEPEITRVADDTPPGRAE